MCKTVLITGAGSGIGNETAFALARRGHRVIATTETEDDVVGILERSQKEGLSIASFTLDITREDDRAKVRELSIDVLINNAGIGESGSLSEVPMERIRKNFEVNVFGTIALTQLILKGMMERKQGTVITISSLAGRAPFMFLNPYSMTKHALSAGMAAMRKELALVAPNVHVSLIEPGAYATGFNERMMQTKYEWMDDSSYFASVHKDLMARDAQFIRYQDKHVQSIVRQIVRATEAKRPRLRYSAPWLQAVGVRVLRIFGA